MVAVSFRLLLDGLPAPPEVMDALQQVEVEDHAEAASMIRLRLSTRASEGGGWTLLDDDLFPRLAEVQVLATLGTGLPEPLAIGHVIETSVDLAHEPGRSTLTVVAMDPSVKMDLEEKVKAWPNMADGDIATQIFLANGLVPVVDRTQPLRMEVDTTTIQRGTDMRFLRMLAQRNGYECYVEVNPTTRLPEGHFHPPRLDGAPQGVLRVHAGDATNVDRFQVRHDLLRAAKASIGGVDGWSRGSADVSSSSLTDLGRTGALADEARLVLLDHAAAFTTDEMQAAAQAAVDRASWSVRAEGELHTVAFGKVLRARRTVTVRGAGSQHSGTYYVERVLHAFTGEGYTQRFTLRRNAVGTTGTERFVT